MRRIYKQWGSKWLVATICVLALGLAGLALAQTVSAAPVDSGTGQGEQGGGSGSNDETVCAIEKMGWILCPLIETSGKVGDSVFQRLSDWFLETEPELFNTDDTQGTKMAWALALNVANLLFIAAFVAIIYSQITGAGLSNYGIKRMLPRLILGAILVNVSYYICQAMVDISNILGYEIRNFMLQAAQSISEHSAMPVNTSGENGTVDVATKNGTLGTIAMGALSLTAVWIILPFLFLGIGTVVITVIVIIVLLLMRKAFIIMLVVVSPIAFVAYLLPNTEKYFQKWFNMFWGLLMVFPVVGFLFGGGQLASAVLLAAGQSSQSDVFSDSGRPGEQGEKCVKLPKMNPGSADDARAELTDCGSGNVSLSLGLVAAGVAVAPLLAVASLLKGALAAAGAIGGKISGAVDRATSSGVNGAGRGASKLGKNMRDKYANSNYNQFRKNKKAERKAAISAGAYIGRGGRLNPRNLKSGANRRLNQNSAFNTVSGGFGANRELLSQALERKNTKEATDMFNGSYDLMQAWAETGGDLNAVASWTNAGGDRLSSTDMQQFRLMRNAGMHRKATSHLAAAQGMSEAGQGSAMAVARALGNAKSVGASTEQANGAWISAQSSYRSAGRGDIFGEMRAHDSASGGVPISDASGLTATAAAISTARRDGWNNVAMSSVHRGGASDASFQRWLLGSADNLRSATAGLNGMEGRARTAASTQIISAAAAHGVTGTGPGGSITINDVKNHFGMTN